MEGLLMSKTYEEWLKYYENATKEQIIEDVEHDNLEIERLNKQLQLISDEFLKYDWENSSKKQIINQLKSLYTLRSRSKSMSMRGLI